MSLRIVATADNHLGQYLARLPLGKLEERRRRLRHAFGRVFDHARDQRADLVVLAGDVFDTPNPRNTDRLYLARCLRSVAGGETRVVAIGGNHDTPRSTSEQGGYSPLDVYAELGGLTFFDQWDQASGPLEPLRFEAGGLRVAIGGMTPTLSLGPEDDPLAGLQFGAPDADVRILVLHGPVEGAVFPDLDVPIIRRATLEQLRDVDLVIVGDVHRFASFSIGTTRVVIPGATEWLNFGDIGATQPGFAVVEVRGRGDIMVRHEACPPQPRVALTIAAGELDPADPNATVLSRLATVADPDVQLRMTIEGTIARDIYARLNLALLEDRGRSDCFSFDLDLTRLMVRADATTTAPARASRRPIADEIAAVIALFQSRATTPGQGAVLQATGDELLAALSSLDEEQR